MDLRALSILLFLLPLSVSAKEIIAVIDTGVGIRNAEAAAALCPGIGIDFTGYGLQDRVGHGTDVLLTIARRVDLSKFCLLPLKWYHTEKVRKITDKPIFLGAIATAIRYAIANHASIINMSIDGDGFFERERDAIQVALNAGIHVVVAAGNSGLDLSLVCPTFPACYRFKSKFFHVVSGVEKDLSLPTWSNYGGPVTASEQYRLMVNGHKFIGTSAATALHTAKLCSKPLYSQQ